MYLGFFNCDWNHLFWGVKKLTQKVTQVAGVAVLHLNSVFFGEKKIQNHKWFFSHESKFSTFGSSYIPPRICCDGLIYQAQGEKTGWSFDQLKVSKSQMKV